METKQITLRSQTTQCPHCGEQYSVTYKYCPFCDVGRKEEERKQAEKKKQRQAKLGGILGSAEPEKKRRPRPEAGEERPRREAPAEEPVKQEAPAEAPVKKAPPRKKESLFFRKEARKKTSEMTEEEKKAHLADREARAAERKRLRDQAAREASLAAGVLDAAAPAYEEDAVPETFGFDQIPDLDVTPVEAQPVSADGPVMVEESAAPAVEEIPVFVSPEMQAEAAAVEAGAEEPAAEPTQWDTLRDLEAVSAPVVEVAAPAPEVEVQPADQVQAPVENSEDLDALLSEIRDMLADSPVPALDPTQLKKPVIQAEIPAAGGAHLAAEPQMMAQEPAPQAEAETMEAPAAEPMTETLVEVVSEAAEETQPQEEIPEAAPIQEPQAQEEPPAQPAPEEPTIVVPVQEIQDAAAQAAPQEIPVDDQPTQILTVAQEAPEEPAPTAVPAPVKEKKPARAKPKAKAQAKAETKGQKKSSRPILLVLSLLLIIAAAAIIIKTVVPSFQDGILSQGQAQEEVQEGEAQTPTDTAETLTLDQTDTSISEKGMTFTLVATLAPEGSTGTVTWASSNAKVASVDQTGLVTTLTPGETTITATLANGVSAQCVVRCTWTGDTPQPSEDLMLSSTNVTLDEVGKTKQIQVSNAEGTIKWSSNKPEVATVSDDGTVTAVAKGGAVITAEVDGKSLTCEVKCIW